MVGTGRCGSAMLWAILRAHPDALSMSEFFGTGKEGTCASRDGRLSDGLNCQWRARKTTWLAWIWSGLSRSAARPLVMTAV